MKWIKVVEINTEYDDDGKEVDSFENIKIYPKSSISAIDISDTTYTICVRGGHYAEEYYYAAYYGTDFALQQCDMLIGDTDDVLIRVKDYAIYEPITKWER